MIRLKSETFHGSKGRTTAHVRALRKVQTPAEELLWKALRNRRLGFKFVRQKPFMVGYFSKKHTFIVDFYNKECAVAVEADGGIHLKHKEYDQLRDNLLNQQHSLHIIRFSNKEIDDNISNLTTKIKNYCESLISGSSPLRLRRGDTAKPRGEA